MTSNIFDEKGNINIQAIVPEYELFYEALKKGKSWYDIIEKLNKTPLTGRKRRNPYIDNTYYKNKRIKLE